MNKWIWIFIILVVLAGGYYFLMGNKTPSQNGAAGPSKDMGLNGSPDQGNLGAPDNGTAQQPDTAQANDSSAQSATLMVASGTSSLGNYLVAQNAMTLYTYSPDTGTPGKSSCSGQCAVNWPPYTVSSAAGLSVANGILGDVGTITRADGSLQVTYKGMPLYFYIKDMAAGDVNGEGVGGVWYVVKP